MEEGAGEGKEVTGARAMLVGGKKLETLLKPILEGPTR